LCATLSANVNINYHLPIKVYYRICTPNCTFFWWVINSKWMLPHDIILHYTPNLIKK
jgi:hypothetical protein